MTLSLDQLGWSPFFQQQLSLEEWDTYEVGRVVEHHRSSIVVKTKQGDNTLPLATSMPLLTVGDWILLDSDGRFHRALDRLSLFSRKAAGSKLAQQLIAANIDTVFVVCSLNDGFNLNRIERYLALAGDAGVEPVVVLTKSDCCDDPQAFVHQVQSLDPLLRVEAVNALSPASSRILTSWCGTGKTVAFLGSSGVGKSTLINTLLGQATQATSAIRDDDSKGRHTTTARSLHILPAGGILLDTPGMRELQLADCEQGINEAFSDISDLSAECRFTDCQHQNEPGCAVRAAIESGRLDERRLQNYHKLMREQALNGASLAEKRARDRSLGRYYRVVLAETKQRKRGG
ncbi:MAG: ribosome small subunit-dependent GTPase A [Gammaproteobacteria bacterium]|nr:ribosome small subunit-dependent GTPase A [Gammaproteobacteria bacterium]